MVKMSDIIKKVKERKTDTTQDQVHEVRTTQRQELKMSEIIREESKRADVGRPVKPEVNISQFLSGKSKLLNEKESEQLYNEAVGLIKNIYDKVKDRREITEEDKNIISNVEKLVDQLSIGNDSILSTTILPAEDNYIYSHAVNVCIISIDIGLGLGYDRSKLIELGTTAILHEIGMVKLHGLYMQKRKLTADELNEIKKHTESGVQILQQFKNINKGNIIVVQQEHERIDGSGYPRGLRSDSINEYAKIIGMTDVYEAMTHARPYRDKINPYEVLKQIIEDKDSFEKKILKVLIQRMAGPFPLNSKVKLSSGEEARVIRRNLGCSFKPIVEITNDASGEKLEKTKIIELARHPDIHIKHSLEK